jgi:hypothetical protein
METPVTGSGTSLPALAGVAKGGPGEVPWGPAVDGIQCRLRPDKLVWKAGEVPTFKVDVRNQGTQQKLTITLAQALHHLEVDGTLYHWVADGAGLLKPLLPGQRYDDIPFTLTDDWSTGPQPDSPPPGIGSGLVIKLQPLNLTPGKHTIRVAMFAVPATAVDALQIKPVRVLSNAIEIEIQPAPAPKSSVYGHWSKPVKGLQGRLVRHPAPKLQDTEIVAISLELKNISTGVLSVRNDPGYLKYQMFGPDKKMIPPKGLLRYGPVPEPQWATLPPDCYLGFSLYDGGVGIPKGKATLLALYYNNCWLLQPGTYSLEATFTVVSLPAPGTPPNVWIGALDLPPLEIKVQ